MQKKHSAIWNSREEWERACDEVAARRAAGQPALPTTWIIDSMCRGDTSHAADLFERCEPIPAELARWLAAALRGDKNLPFRLEAIGNPKPGQKRPGRRVENHAWRDIVLSSRVYDAMNEGKSFEEAINDVAVHYALGESLVRKAYTEQKENGRALAVSGKDFANRMLAPHGSGLIKFTNFARMESRTNRCDEGSKSRDLFGVKPTARRSHTFSVNCRKGECNAKFTTSASADGSLRLSQAGPRHRPRAGDAG